MSIWASAELILGVSSMIGTVLLFLLSVCFCLISQSNLQFSVFLPVVLSPSERALLPGAQSQVLLGRDCQRLGIPPLPQHRLQGPEA